MRTSSNSGYTPLNQRMAEAPLRKLSQRERVYGTSLSILVLLPQ